MVSRSICPPGLPRIYPCRRLTASFGWPGVSSKRPRLQFAASSLKLPSGSSCITCGSSCQGLAAASSSAASLQAIANAAAFAQLQALPQTRVGSSAELNQRLQQVLQIGGEGLVLHLADAPYQTGRKPALLKLKPEDDDEAVVLAHLPGQGRFAGMLGALRVRNAQGLVFQLGTGFSDAQRRTPPSVGTTVTHRYRGLTDKGLPRFASYLRVQDL